MPGNRTRILIGAVLMSLGCAFVANQVVMAQLAQPFQSSRLNPFAPTLMAGTTGLTLTPEPVVIRRPPTRDPFRPPTRSPFVP